MRQFLHERFGELVFRLNRDSGLFIRIRGANQGRRGAADSRPARIVVADESADQLIGVMLIGRRRFLVSMKRALGHLSQPRSGE